MLEINLDKLDEWIEIIPESHVKTRDKYRSICKSIRRVYEKDMASHVESYLQKLYQLTKRYENNDRFVEYKNFLDRAVAATSNICGDVPENYTTTPLAKPAFVT